MTNRMQTFFPFFTDVNRFSCPSFPYRSREIGVVRKIVEHCASPGQARQVFWWRRDARRPSYSRLLAQPPRFVLAARNPEPYCYALYIYYRAINAKAEESKAV